MFVVDAQGNYVDWNPAALAMVGVMMTLAGVLLFTMP